MPGAEIGTKELELLSSILLEELRKEFQDKYLSKNLINTIQIETSSKEINIKIPAQTYNMLLFQAKGVVIHTSHGSYASKLDTVGSEFYIYPHNSRKGSYLAKPHNHQGYIDRIINNSIQKWSALIKLKVKGIEK